MDDFQWKTGRRDDRADFSISLIRLGCLPFCMQIVFDYPVLYNLLGFFCFFLVSLNCSWFIWQIQVPDITKWQPQIWKVILSFIVCFYLHFLHLVCVCVYLSVTDKSTFGPPNRLCGSVESLGHVGCQGARKCPPPPPFAWRNCQWKCYHQINLSWATADTSMGGRMNARKGIHIARHVLVGWGWRSRSGKGKLTKQIKRKKKKNKPETIMEPDDRSLFPRSLFGNRNRDGRIAVATFVLIIHVKNPLSDTSTDKMPLDTEKSWNFPALGATKTLLYCFFLGGGSAHT